MTMSSEDGLGVAHAMSKLSVPSAQAEEPPRLQQTYSYALASVVERAGAFDVGAKDGRTQ